MKRAAKLAEERKREARFHPAKKWEAVLSAIRWTESQAALRRNTPRACLAKQSRLLGIPDGR